MRPLAVSTPLLAAALLLVFTTGCHTLGKLRQRPSQPFVSAQHQATEPQQSSASSCPVDTYFQQCAVSWYAIQCADNSAERKSHEQSYNLSLGRLLESACHHQRFDPERGLLIVDNGEATVVPVDYDGFAWNISDFQRWHFPPRGYEPLLVRHYRCDGVGFPIVVERCRCDFDPVEARFFPERSYFNATPVLQFHDAQPGESCASLAQSAQLTFFDPLQVRDSTFRPSIASVARDHSAAPMVELRNSSRTYFAGFIDPAGGRSSAKLSFVEPYQPGKVPVVLIHGLYSDPLSWADLINDLRSVPEFEARYQIWTFRYPTGQGFLQSATALRRELQAAIAMLDPEQTDPALRSMVLVGHSMGGLIAKLQITHSDELIWNKLSNRPIEEITTTERTRAFLAENAFFDPATHISRVIFIATPHRGSLTSSGLVGRGASLLVEASPEQEKMLHQLIRDNPDTFDPRIGRRLPTSIDMLSPQSPLLEVMRQMRLKCDVRLHNIIGCSQAISLDGPSDGVVSVRSAYHPWCESEYSVNQHHSGVHRTIEASEEILRILRLPPTNYRRHRFAAPRAPANAPNTPTSETNVDLQLHNSLN